MNTIGPFTTDMYLPAFSAIATGLGTTVHEIGYSLSSYFLGISLGQLLHGPLVDRFGRKKPLLVFLTLYIVASLACSWATSVEGLVVFRFLQALAASCGMVVSRAVVRDLFPPEKTAKVFSMLILVMGVAPIIAPTIGGYVVAAWSWQAVFWVLAGIGTAVLIMVSAVLPESKGPDRSVSLRPLPVLKNFAAVFSMPLFKPFALALAMNTGGLFGYISGASYVFMELLGLSERQFGWVFGLNAIGFISGSQVNRLFLRFAKTHEVAFRANLVQLALGAALIFVVWENWVTLPIMISLTVAYTFCLGLVGPNVMALTLAPFTKNVGVASATLGSLQMGAGALAAALISFFSHGSALPMVVVMAATAMVGITGLRTGIRQMETVKS